ncbi:TetR/AcrR family transcriptional regulator [Sciscionella sediminilitoris]|uniref:TetR/AcrR family transcriptional regulator n=1 Tax=Sciscionella sediminilitoris TaxID=1445613 RepID=UPI0012E1DFB9|nr:TetR/AcrR family transcriptional regulator [Sciscionella sp. SE31]
MGTQANSGRQRLLEAAHRLFYAHGVHGVGIDTVIEEAGVAKMTLYRNFGSKDELVAAYLAERDEYWRDRWRARTSQADRRERVRGFFDVLVEWAAEKDFRGCAFVNAHGEHDQGPATLAAITAHKEWVRAHLRGITGDDALAEQLFALMEGAAVITSITGGSSTVHQARIAALTLLDAQPEREHQSAGG